MAKSKGAFSGRLEANPTNGARHRKAFTVHILEKDGTRRSFECGSSVVAMKLVKEVARIYGAKLIDKMGHTEEIATTSGTTDKPIDPEELETWGS